MEQDVLYNGILETLSKELNTDVDDLSLDEEMEFAGINSLKFVQIIISLEGRFDVEFEDEALDYVKFASLREFCKFAQEWIMSKMPVLDNSKE